MKTIIVSGASGNLGNAVAQHFIEQGDRVIGLVHHKKEGKLIENYHEIEIDLMNDAQTAEKIKALISTYKKIDAAVLTAGGFKVGNLSHTKAEDLMFQYKLNFLTAYNVAQPLLSHFEENQSGKIFFIGSEPGKDTSTGKGVVAYSLAKSQLFQLTKIINSTYKKEAITAHVIVPSTIDTPQNRKAVPNADFSKWEKPEDIAGIIVDYTNGNKKSKSVIVIKEEL